MEGTEKQAKFEVRETLKKNTGYASLENLHNLYKFVSSATKIRK